VTKSGLGLERMPILEGGRVFKDPIDGEGGSVDLRRWARTFHGASILPHGHKRQQAGVGQRPRAERRLWDASITLALHPPTVHPLMRAVAASAPARDCVKTPRSRIAFPLEARIAPLRRTLAPLPGQTGQAIRDRSPPP
jgi:hypothetical protein